MTRIFVLALCCLTIVLSASVADCSAIEYPADITIKCGKLKLQLNERTYWNINRIWSDDYLLGEGSGFWGTVFAFDKVGFIGSGHKESGETEEVLSLELFADGQPVSAQQARETIVCQTFRVVKRARVRSITFDYEFLLEGDYLQEKCALSSPQTVKVPVMYNFMHPWSRRINEYYVAVDNQTAQEGTFKADSKFLFDDKAEWLAIYDSAAKIGVVQRGGGDPATWKLWDRTGNKKIYLSAAHGKQLIVGKTYNYSMTTHIFRSEPQSWRETAARLIGTKYFKKPDGNISVPDDKSDEFTSFPQIRKRLKGMKPYTDEDYRLGAELIRKIRELARQRKPVFGRTLFFARSQPYRSGRLYYCRYAWTDRPLFANRKLWEPDESDYKSVSFVKTLKLYDSYGLDGYSTFFHGYDRNFKVIYEACERAGLDPDKFHILAAMTPTHADVDKFDKRLGVLADTSQYTLRWQNTPVFASYTADRLLPDKLAEYKRNFEKLCGKKAMLIAQIYDFNVSRGWREKYGSSPETKFRHIYAINLLENKIPATLLLHHFDYLTSYLRAVDGINIGMNQYTGDLKVDMRNYRELALPLFAAAVAQPEFNGKKLFGNDFKVGYTSFHGSQTLSRDGTKTLRNFLDLTVEFKPDTSIGTEWDELNEDTNLEPMVAKPMASQRIIKYYTRKLRGLPPTPNPNDDLSLPNLILSMRRQLSYSWPVEVELLNVPDGTFDKKYTAQLELLDQNLQVVFRSNPLEFNASELKDHTLVLPSSHFAACQVLQPRLRITGYKGEPRTVDEGLPFTVLRATSCWDHTWLNTPLRNVLFPQSNKVKFAEGPELTAGVKRVNVAVDLDFADKLNSVEVVQNSRELYAYDPHNEFLQNSPDRRLYKLTTAYHNKPDKLEVMLKTSIDGAPSAKTFLPHKDPQNRDFEDPTKQWQAVDAFADGLPKRTKLSYWTGEELISVKTDEVDQAILHVSGVRIAGPYKDQPFEWSIPLKELGEYGIKSKVFEDGVMVALETGQRPIVLPLPLEAENAVFKASVNADDPNGVLGLRAVSLNGKVYWSRAWAVNRQPSEQTVPITYYSQNKTCQMLNIATNRAPDIVYDFTPRAGNILTTPAGREYYAHAGSFLSTAIDFKGLISSLFTIPQCFRNQLPGNYVAQPAPQWSHQPDGSWALEFKPEHHAFLALPNTVVPQRSGFVLEFEIKPRQVESPQIIFAQYGTYLTGFRLRIEGGKFHIDFRRRAPHDATQFRENMLTFATDLPLKAGKWQSVQLKYDERRVYLTVAGKTASFPCEGIGMWLSLSVFGGGAWPHPTPATAQCYDGLLRDIRISRKM